MRRARAIHGFNIALKYALRMRKGDAAGKQVYGEEQRACTRFAARAGILVTGVSARCYSQLRCLRERVTVRIPKLGTSVLAVRAGMRYTLVVASVMYSLCAKSYVMSPVLPPAQQVMNNQHVQCSEKCLKRLFDLGYYLSYIARYRPNTNDVLKSNFQVAASFLDFMVMPHGVGPSRLKIALLIPQKVIGRYSITTTGTIMSYLSTRDVDYEFKVFNAKTEDPKALREAYNQIYKEEYRCVIAVLTINGLRNLVSNTEITLPIYIPTINKGQVDESTFNQQLIFGGISYEEQVDVINKYADSMEADLILYNDDGHVGKMIGSMFNKRSGRVIDQEVVNSKGAADFGEFAKKIKDKAENSVIVLNTPVTKSGLIIPQLTMQEVNPINYMSTQINFNPSLFTLTQVDEVDKLLVVNAIGEMNPILLTNAYMLNSNLKYDWVNYSTAIGVELFLINDNKGLERLFNETVQQNQVRYRNRLYKVKDSRFVLN